VARRIKFYLTARGDSPVEVFLDSLSVKARAKCLSYLTLLAEQGNTLSANYIRHLEGDLWELRPEFGGTEYRLLYVVVTTEAVVVLHAFTKKTQRTPPGEIARALSRLAEVQEQADYEQNNQHKPTA